MAAVRTDPSPGELSPAQRQVLTALKRRGEATAADLATTLDVSPTATRQHLAALRAAGLVEGERLRGQPGRPVELYRATDLAEPLFEITDGDFSSELLGFIADEDPALVGRIFDRRRQLIVEDALARLNDTEPHERVGIVTSLLDEQGYLADFEEVRRGHYQINLRSCAIWSVANQFGEACTSELDLIKALIPEASIERTATKTDGSHTCCYDVTVA